MSIDDRDLVYGRFLHDLYRRWWLAVLVGGGFLVLALVAVSPVYSQSTVFQTIVSGQLTSAGLDRDILATQLTLNVDANAISGSQVRSEIQQQIGSEIKTSIAVGPDTVGLSVSSNDHNAVTAAGDEYVKRFIASRTPRFGAALDAVAAELKSSSDLFDARIADIDSKLATTADPSGSLANALVSARQDAMRDLGTDQRKLAAINAVRSDPSSVIQVVRTTVDKSSLRRSAAGAGALVFGFMLLAGLTYLMAGLDRRARSLTDVEVASGLSVLGVLAENPAPEEIRKLGAVVASAMAHRGATVVHVIPVGTAADVDAFIADLSIAIKETVGSPNAIACRSLRDDASSVALGGTALIVARSGSSRRADVRQVARDLRFAGKDTVGVVLCGVPRGELVWAGSGRIG